LCCYASTCAQKHHHHADYIIAVPRAQSRLAEARPPGASAAQACAPLPKQGLGVGTEMLLYLSLHCCFLSSCQGSCASDSADRQLWLQPPHVGFSICPTGAGGSRQELCPI